MAFSVSSTIEGSVESLRFNSNFISPGSKRPAIPNDTVTKLSWDKDRRRLLVSTDTLQTSNNPITYKERKADP